MDIFITGGTGFVGSSVVRALVKKGHHVTVLTRSLHKAESLSDGVRTIQGNPTKPGSWQDEITKHEAIINLAGASIFRKWTKAYKQKILQSRILSTQNITSALSKQATKQIHLLNASAVGYYGDCGDKILDEDSPAGDDFLATVSSRWEKMALEAEPLGIRVVLCRLGIVLGREGGALAQMRKIFERYLGAQLGEGKQWFSWIQLEDLSRIFCFLLEKTELTGPINCTSPHPVQNKELTQTLAHKLGKSTLLPKVPGFVLKLVLGEFAQTLLHGQRVIPQKLLENGFEFRYEILEESLNNLLNK